MRTLICALLSMSAACFKPALERETDSEGDLDVDVSSPDLEVDGLDDGSSDTSTPGDLDGAPVEDTPSQPDVTEVNEDTAAHCEPLCGHGGRCVAGSCDCAGTGFTGVGCEIPVCGDVECPELEGYRATCSDQRFCEYRRISPTASWHEHDVWIFAPPGSFEMGTPAEDPVGREDERPVRTVTFERGFFVGKYEVTVETYEACEALGACLTPGVVDSDPGTWGVNRSDLGRGTHPQNGLTWTQAGAVCGRLSGRLPTEAEWEYAAVGIGARRRYPWGDSPGPGCGHAIINTTTQGGGLGCGAGGTWSVGSRPDGASAIGAMDMAGNVAEWVRDCYLGTYEGAPVDGTAPTPCISSTKVHRGGHYALGFTVAMTQFRVADRASASAEDQRATLGVRCVRDLPRP